MVATPRQLPVPSYYDDSQAGNFTYSANHDRAAAAAIEVRKEFKIRPACEDVIKVSLVSIDGQRAFTSPDGELPCLGRSGIGGPTDMANGSKLVYRYGHVFTLILRSKDRHRYGQIFFSEFWVDNQGIPVPCNLEILWLSKYQIFVAVAPGTVDVVVSNIRPNRDLLPFVAPGKDYQWLCAYCIHYCTTLEKRDQYRLYLWNKHCIDGTIGQTIDGAFDEACAWYSALRNSPPIEAPKGDYFLTEFLGVFEPELTTAHDGTVIAHGKDWIDPILDFGKEVWLGEASSHCVAQSMRQRIRRRKARGQPVSDMYLVRDATSPVVVRDQDGKPIVDFTEVAERAFEEFRAAGVHIVESTTPMEEWEGMEHLKAA